MKLFCYLLSIVWSLLTLAMMVVGSGDEWHFPALMNLLSYIAAQGTK